MSKWVQELAKKRRTWVCGRGAEQKGPAVKRKRFLGPANLLIAPEKKQLSYVTCARVSVQDIVPEVMQTKQLHRNSEDWRLPIDPDWTRLFITTPSLYFHYTGLCWSWRASTPNIMNSKLLEWFLSPRVTWSPLMPSLHLVMVLRRKSGHHHSVSPSV